MPNVANITAVITAQDKASTVLQGFGSNVDKTAESSTSSLSKLNTSFLAVTAATAGLVAFGKKSFDAFNQQDLAVTRLKAGIQNVTSATDKNVDSLIKQATQLQKTTRFSDEAYISAQGILSTFQLNQDAIAKLTPRLADMSEGLARVTGEMPDLEGNAILVAKAIGGEDVAGLTGALRRVGVVMTKHQEELLQTGTVQERVAIITKVLDQNFQGLAVSAGSTTAGKVAELKNQFNELEESVGKLIAVGLTPLLNVLNQHPAVLATVAAAAGFLAVTFIGVKLAATGMFAVLANPVVLAIAGALADLALLYNAIKSVEGAFHALAEAQRAAESYKASANSVHQQLLNLSRTGTPEQQARANKALAAGLASGGPMSAGQPYMVGEQGPELIIPSQAGTVIPNNKLSGMANNLNININVGALMGNDVEARKFAQMIVKHYNDAMQSKSRMAMA